jgi:hypothetical protein
MIYLYCVLTSDAEAPPAGMRGVGGAAVRAVALGDEMEAWVASVDEAELRLTGPALATQALLHNAVIDAVLAMGHTPLPARFGALFTDDAACAAYLHARSSGLRSALEHLAGAVEMAVLLVPRSIADSEEPRLRRDEPSAGRRYLEAVRGRALRAEAGRAAVEALVRRVDDAVREVARDYSRGRSGAALSSLAHLVRRADVDRYRDIVRRIDDVSGFRLVVAGPRAPYSFVAASALRPGHDSSSLDGND